MKKVLTVVAIVPFIITGLFPSGFALNLNIGYNAGNSKFFGSTQELYSSEGYNYLENSKYMMGIGFGLNLFVPVTKKINLIPGIAVDYGNRNYDFKRVEMESDADLKDSFYFHIVRADLKADYDIIRLKNGWVFSILWGIGYNSVKADTEIDAGKKEFFSGLFGISVKFFQLKHFGFNVSAIYNYPFGNKNFEYLTFNGGIIIKF